MENSEDLKEQISQRLTKCRRRVLEEEYLGEAAVLIPVMMHEGGPHLLLTLRSDKVATHKGQISFPGGLREEVDATLLQTALRETEEEIGVSGNDVEILGSFHDFMAVTRYRVTPFVGVLKQDLKISLNPREVKSILEVPLDFFQKHRPREELHRRLGREMTVYFYEYQGISIWGLTAAMIKEFVELL